MKLDFGKIALLGLGAGLLYGLFKTAAVPKAETATTTPTTGTSGMAGVKRKRKKKHHKGRKGLGTVISSNMVKTANRNAVYVRR